MRKLLVLSMALVMSVFLITGVYAGSQFKVDDFEIDSNGQMNYVALVEVFATSDTLTAAESGKICLMESASTPALMTLPADASGVTFTFVDGKGTGFMVDPSGTDRIKLLTLEAGDQIVSAGSVGDTLTVWASADGTWFANPHGVTYTDQVP